MGEQPADHEQESSSVARPRSPYLTTVEAAAVVKLAPATLRNMRAKGVGPTYRKHGRLVRYHIDDLDAWSVSRQIDPASRRSEQISDG